MNQGVIQDFLNVPGIVGIALLSGQSQPVFYPQPPVFARTEVTAISGRSIGTNHVFGETSAIEQSVSNQDFETIRVSNTP